ncbi:MAG: nucleotidyl transferase AbiEii/AbiGii toxin family protein [Deltaproteobacteria bacterium]|nr:nucleotidyl transferase AbiEii/AbiGii toxin family protein [Deltaproteobacteria bacterium]
MRISKERILTEAASTGFRPEIFEKVAQIFSLLQGIWRHPFLKNRLVLKGGTALNLFILDVPRLSVDIDLNYIGGPDKETMLAERTKLNNAITAVCQREGFMLRESPSEHAGGKWLLRYESAFGQGANLTIDVNFMFRIPLWPVALLNSRQVGSYLAEDIPVLDINELAAGKLCALLSRQTARDLFDAHLLLTGKMLDKKRLRLSFVVYGALNRKDWRTISAEDIGYNANEFMNELIPVLRANKFKNDRDRKTWALRMVDECRKAASIVLPLRKGEREFLERILDDGEIIPSLLTKDKDMADRILNHPGLQWKALNVREFRNTRNKKTGGSDLESCQNAGLI